MGITSACKRKQEEKQTEISVEHDDGLIDAAGLDFVDDVYADFFRLRFQQSLLFRYDDEHRREVYHGQLWQVHRPRQSRIPVVVLGCLSSLIHAGDSLVHDWVVVCFRRNLDVQAVVDCCWYWQPNRHLRQYLVVNTECMEPTCGRHLQLQLICKQMKTHPYLSIFKWLAFGFTSNRTYTSRNNYQLYHCG